MKKTVLFILILSIASLALNSITKPTTFQARTKISPDTMNTLVDSIYRGINRISDTINTNIPSFRDTTKSNLYFNVNDIGIKMKSKVTSGSDTARINIRPKNASSSSYLTCWDTAGTSAKIWMFQSANRPQIYLYNDAGSADVLIYSTASQGIVQANKLIAVDKITFSNVPEHADNAAAITAGLAAGDFYRTGDALKVVH